MTKKNDTSENNKAINYEPLLCPVFLDKHGLTIKDGDIIQNLYNEPPRQQVEIIQGELWFGAEGTTLNAPDNDWVKLGEEHGTDKYWEVVS
ncbi:MAG: hypothetical protein GY679_04450 [Mycoplasma sp.]|nr:hypothetical protein [Mycoplasma sp.]